MYRLPNTVTLKQPDFFLLHDLRIVTFILHFIYHLMSLPHPIFVSFFLTICFSIPFPPFFIPSPATVPGGVSPNTPTQAERLFLNPFGMTGGRKGSKPLFVEEGCSGEHIKLGVLTLLVLYLSAPLNKPV